MGELKAKFIPFSAFTRLSGIDTETSVIRKGAVDAILTFVRSAAAVPAQTADGTVTAMRSLVSDTTVHALNVSADRIAKSGGTPLAVARDGRLLGIIHLKDIIKGGIRERFGDSDPTKLIEIVEIGKQLLMTRGALTTFSIANDVAKYFAIIPAAFVVFYPQLQSLNIMHLATPQSAILSAIIFNALIIVALIPLSLRGVAYRPVGAASILRRNLLVYGLGGIIVPFIGIKLIVLVVGAIHLA